ncbi:hypothetical protein AvCA_08120 [Azotobacter vinelandii CA]|uniref:Uncharacterized protein n=2 Tax=Azotobacter vinelandii TaxID=354 RepID=C1DMM7_AZOVD|nr:hypothetical protein Avin_08120 [Azotobacter vinelandii DJ]AGK15506.1 hypothetical protein AvCA_08120 [Azotobacter vinelandii CA]AGK19532.1 hypothetical protein AvCA6_08120 [Azotobacter vinelandii CA6]
MNVLILLRDNRIIKTALFDSSPMHSMNTFNVVDAYISAALRHIGLMLFAQIKITFRYLWIFPFSI